MRELRAQATDGDHSEEYVSSPLRKKKTTASKDVNNPLKEKKSKRKHEHRHSSDDEAGHPSKRSKQRTSAENSDDDAIVTATVKKKSKNLSQLRETESERLLKEVKELARQKEKTYEQVVAKLKKQVAALSAQQVKRKEDVETLGTETTLQLDALQRERAVVTAENQSLRRRIRDLETQVAQFKRSTGPDDQVVLTSASTAALNATKEIEENLELAQANKLLDLYRLVTCTDIRLVDVLDEEDVDAGDYTDISCTTTDSATGKQLHFEMAIPFNEKDEIEYLPSESPNKDFKLPSYLRDELSFKRSEMSKFMRTLLDIVIRKKNTDGKA